METASSWTALNLLYDIGNTAKRMLIEKIFRKVFKNIFGRKRLIDTQSPNTTSGSSSSSSSRGNFRSKLRGKERNDLYNHGKIHRKDVDADDLKSINSGKAADVGSGYEEGSTNGYDHGYFRILDALQLPFR